MKNLLFALALLISFSGYAQEKRIQVTSKNPTFPPQYVVVEKDSMSVEDGYQRAMEWIKVTYKDPSKVILSEIENKYIRIGGFTSGLYIADRMGLIAPYNVNYTIEFNFREGKVKFEVTGATFDIPASTYNGIYSSAKTYDLMFNHPDLFKKNGKPKYEYKKATKVTNYFNDLVSNFSEYVMNPVSNSSSTSDDDW
jgi:hypothetical protein